MYAGLLLSGTCVIFILNVCLPLNETYKLFIVSENKKFQPVKSTRISKTNKKSKTHKNVNKI